MNDLDLHAPHPVDGDAARCGRTAYLIYLSDEPEGVTCPRCCALIADAS